MTVTAATLPFADRRKFEELSYLPNSEQSEIGIEVLAERCHTSVTALIVITILTAVIENKSTYFFVTRTPGLSSLRN